MEGLPGIANWKCTITADGMVFENVEIIGISNAGVVIREKETEKFIPYSVVRVITKTGEIKATAMDFSFV